MSFEQPSAPPLNWDIFCRVIDNYGDIGVTWRLARLLTTEYRQNVRLWVDDRSALARLMPDTDPDAESQCLDGVEVRHWPLHFPAVTPADIVIEGFGCALPPDYAAAMPHQTRLWFNLDYFTAEAWATGYHGLPSPQPNGIPKIFAFPGLRSGTGGLIREAQLLIERQYFLHNPDMRAAWAARWHIPLPPPDHLTLLLFGYENAALGDALATWAASPTPITAYLPEGRLLASARAALHAPELATGMRYQKDNLTLQVLPFLPQSEFDRLLWLCDLNFVRGEDSLSRAIWAGKPLIWQIYPTEDDAHWVKLDAFLTEWGQTLPPHLFNAWQQLNHHWNAQTFHPEDWRAIVSTLPDLRRHAERQMARLSEGEELTHWLVKTAKQRLQCATI